MQGKIVTRERKQRKDSEERDQEGRKREGKVQKVCLFVFQILIFFYSGKQKFRPIRLQHFDQFARITAVMVECILRAA